MLKENVSRKHFCQGNGDASGLISATQFLPLVKSVHFILAQYGTSIEFRPLSF